MANGGKREGAGRKPGSPNKVTASVREAAQEHGPEALDRLVFLSKNAVSEAVQVTATKEILDRAYGKSSQSVELTGKDGGPIETVEIELSETERARRIAFILQNGIRANGHDADVGH